VKSCTGEQRPGQSRSHKGNSLLTQYKKSPVNPFESREQVHGNPFDNSILLISLNKKYAKSESRIFSFLFSILSDFKKILNEKITRNFVLCEETESHETRIFPSLQDW
jgi:hypothetical protein